MSRKKLYAYEDNMGWVAFRADLQDYKSVFKRLPQFDIDSEPENIDDLKEKIRALQEAMKPMLEVCEAAYWDVYSAGNFPGSGYTNKAQHKAGLLWNWRNENIFKKFHAEVRELLK